MLAAMRGQWAVLCLLWIAWPAAGQGTDESSGPTGDDAAGSDAPRERVLYLREVRQIEELSDDVAGKAFAVLGRVTLELPGVFRLRAERAVIWLDPDVDQKLLSLVRELGGSSAGVPLWAVRGIYAEGGQTPAVFQAAGQIFRCGSLYFDFERWRGTIVDADLRLRRRGDRTAIPDIVLRAREFKTSQPGVWEGRDVSLFSSNYAEHDVFIEVDRVVLRDDSLAKAIGELTHLRRKGGGPDGPTLEELRATATALTATAGNLESKRLSLYDIAGRAYGRTFFRWGHAEVDGSNVAPLRIELEAGSNGSLGTGGRVGLGWKSKPLSWLVAGAYYDGRGPLLDAELEWDAWDGALRGRSFGVYIHDHGSDRGIVPPTRDRFWTKHQYRLKLAPRWRLDLEFADISDAQWLRTYDEREFKEGKEQETLTYLLYRGRLAYASLTAKVRTIGFQETLEERPRGAVVLPVLTLWRIGADGRGRPVLLQAAASLEVGNLRRRTGDAFLPPDFRTARADFDPTLFVSFFVGAVRIVPFAVFRFTGYENALDGSSTGRFAGSAGVRADVQLSRWFGDVRHTMNVSFEFEDLHTLTRASSRLFALDDIDRVTPFERLGVRWRHRFARHTPEGLAEFLSVELFAAWFPDRQQPLGRMGDGFIEFDAEWTPREGWRVASRAEIDTERGSLDTASLESWWRVQPRLLLSAGLRHLDRESDILTFTADFELDRRWRIFAFSQVDFKNGDGLDQGLLIQRLGKTAVIGVRLAFDPGDDDFRFSVKIDLLERFRKDQRKRDQSARDRIGWR